MAKEQKRKETIDKLCADRMQLEQQRVQAEKEKKRRDKELAKLTLSQQLQEKEDTKKRKQQLEIEAYQAIQTQVSTTLRNRWMA